MSISMTLARTLVGLLVGTARDESELRARAATPRTAAKLPRALGRNCSVDRIGGCDVVTLYPAVHGPDTPRVLYLHGGAYVNPLVRPHWSLIGALMHRVEAVVTVPMYPLAPQHTVDDALAFLDEVGAADVGQTRRTVVCGDSAGGGLALAYALRRRDSGSQPASALLLFAPWVDVTLTNPAIVAIEPLDPMLRVGPLRICGAWWAGSRTTSDPAVSPLRADLSGLPPMHTFIGNRDILYPDAEELHRRVQQVGGTSTLNVVDGGFHVYMGAPWIPESRRTLDQAARLIAA